MRFNGIVSLLLAVPASAELLWATSYNDHTVTTLELKDGELKVLFKSTDCGSEPTWLTLNKAKKILYCLNEGWGGAASITSFKVNADGSLETLDILPVLKSPVSSTLFGPNKNSLAVAHYDTSTFSTFSVADPSALSLSGNETYQLAAPGPNPARQEVPHLHDAILDPTGKFIAVPDLGSDLIRLYAVEGSSWKAIAPAVAVPGSGPRHGGFAVKNSKTYFYTVNELSNTLTGYRATYNSDGTLSLARLFDHSIHGVGGTPVPEGTSSAELEVTKDGRFLIISSRFENSLEIDNPDNSGTKIVSDPLISFSINYADGSLTAVQYAPAGGSNPRGFSVNKAGTLVASALQNDNRVVIYARDAKKGLLKEVVASATVGEGENNGPNYVIFNE